MSQVIDSLDDARAAGARQAWRDAYAGYGNVDPKELTPSDLETYAEAAWWSGKLDEAIGLRERAHTVFNATGDKHGAARMALALAWDYEGRGAFAVSYGWLATARRLLETLPESPEYSRLLLTDAMMAMYAEGDLERAESLFESAFALAQRVGDPDVQILALSGKGRAYIKAGRIEEGLALLDEATASASSGGAKSHATGLVYCLTISSCRDLGDFRRAAEWTEAANRWCDQLDVAGFPGACRIHRAEVLRLRGDWPAAEVQAQAACEELHDFDRSITADGHYEIGEIRRQRGDFEGAEAAYRTANEHGRDPQPGLALLRLAEGKVDAAVAGISRTLEDVQDPLIRLRRLPAQVEIAIAAGDLRTARGALDELERIVDSYKIAERRAVAFDATIDHASGQIKLAEKDWNGAAASLQHAKDGWQSVGAPYETARARMLLGIAYRRSGDEHGGTVEIEGALAGFERLGARLDEERAKELLGKLEARRTFLFTDIVDSTKLLDTLGDEKWKRLLARHDELVRERIVETGGEVVKKTGDGFFASFDNPKAAIDAAIAIQRGLAAEIVAPDVRIGAHSGGAFRSGTDATDYGGQGVHVAARIGAAAGAAEILVSRETLDGVATSFRLSEPRSEVLKGFEEPIEVVSVDWR
ncbi:MAG: LuxR family transcriptional regulator [Thermoleophilia bacterium]|nr:LuxR family transcriptional regulator [Thermoleophilia bacterium]MDH4340576.1 LuxR family transcriptional regulator [Thermoleophilia bacterium]